MTQQGYDVLQEELKKLKEIERPAIIEAIAEARDHGDLSENAEYHSAREKQSFIEGRIAEVEALVSLAEVIDTSAMTPDTVKFGATVVIACTETDTEKTYTIVGDPEADLDKGKISLSSPVARALIGKAVEDLITVQAPGGEKEYEIVLIEYR